MKTGRFEQEVADEKISRILSCFSAEQPVRLRQICEQYGENTEEVRRYDVYLADFPSGTKVLKKTDPHEAFIYETFLVDSGFSVPRYFGKYQDEGALWILIENIEGEDLRNMTDRLALAAADTLSQIQNAYWQADEKEFSEKKMDDRFEVYWQRIQNRLSFAASDPVLQKAYQLFADRQLTCPRTLSHGDLLEMNMLYSGNQVYAIDWECGGIMPYSLDIARFIAHASVDRCTFPYSMTDAQKKLFVDRVYEKLERKPKYDQYLLDIKLAALHEYVGFSNGEDGFNKWYQQHAANLAEELLQQ